jgi:uncharacterized membrane protein HdeD (DUF308 family)
MSYFERDWWVFLVRGALAIFLGVLCFVTPAMSLVFLIALIGTFWLLDGVTALVAIGSAAHDHRPWGWLLFEGLVSIAAVAAIWLEPGLTALMLLLFLASWCVVVGVFRIASAIALRKVIAHDWYLATSGVLSLAFGVLLFARPGAGALAVVWVVGLYAVMFGALLVSFGFRLHGLSVRAHERQAPV